MAELQTEQRKLIELHGDKGPEQPINEGDALLMRIGCSYGAHSRVELVTRSEGSSITTVGWSPFISRVIEEIQYSIIRSNGMIELQQGETKTYHCPKDADEALGWYLHGEGSAEIRDYYERLIKLEELES